MLLGNVQVRRRLAVASSMMEYVDIVKSTNVQLPHSSSIIVEGGEKGRAGGGACEEENEDEQEEELKRTTEPTVRSGTRRSERELMIQCVGPRCT
jgi:hypothetical protein